MVLFYRLFVHCHSLCLQVLNTDFSANAAAQCMNRLAKLSARWIGTRGFSIGIDDVTPKPELVRKKQRELDDGYAQVSCWATELHRQRGSAGSLWRIFKSHTGGLPRCNARLLCHILLFMGRLLSC